MVKEFTCFFFNVDLSQSLINEFVITYYWTESGKNAPLKRNGNELKYLANVFVVDN